MEMKSLTIGDNIYDLPRWGGDWNVNDPTADDYIKNRPFYKGEENIITLIPETTIDVTEGEARLEVEDGGVAFNIAKDNVGKFVKVQYNDVIDYGLIQENEGSSYGIFALNTIIGINSAGHAISVNCDPNTANVVFHASIDNTEIHKISSDYLPISSIEGTGGSSIILNGSMSKCKADGDCSVAEGFNTTAYASSSHAEGYNTTASGTYSHAEGRATTASGERSHAEGESATASGTYSHAEGANTIASQNGSHAEGESTTASGYYSHAEGYSTTASGGISYAEGNTTTASGYSSHAEGFKTTANHLAQHVFGEYNIADPSSAGANSRGNYVEIVGNGTSDATKSNARTLDWSGNESLQGSLTLGMGTADETTITAAQLKALLAMLAS